MLPFACLAALLRPHPHQWTPRVSIPQRTLILPGIQETLHEDVDSTDILMTNVVSSTPPMAAITPEDDGDDSKMQDALHQLAESESAERSHQRPQSESESAERSQERSRERSQERSQALAAIEAWANAPSVKNNNGNGAAVIPDRTAPISLGNGCPTPASSENIVAAIDAASGDFRGGHMLDIGSGDGYFLMRAAVLCTACTTFTGIEIERSRWETSMQYRDHPLLQPFREYLEATGKTIDFYYGDATSIHHRKLVYSVTHVYMFDKVFNVNTHFLLSPILDQSRSLRIIATTFSLKKSEWGYLHTFRHVVDATTGERVHKPLTLRKSNNQTFECWILTRTDPPRASPSTFCAFVPNPPRVVIRSETARSISATVQDILEAHANSTPETAYHAACVYLEQFRDASNAFEPFLAKHVRKFLLIRHWLDSFEPIHVQVHRSAVGGAAAAAASGPSEPTRTHPDVKIGIHTKRLHGQACPTGKEKVATSSWEGALQRNDLQECGKVSCTQVWAQYKAARANHMYKQPQKTKGKQAASASSALSATASSALRPHKSTVTLQRQTVEPPWRQMDIVCPLYFGQSSLDIDGLLGVYFESPRMEDLMQNPDYHALLLAHQKREAEAKARQQSDSVRFVAAAVAAVAATATTTVATSSAVGSEMIRRSNRVPENRDVHQAELLQRLIAQRRAHVDQLDPIVQAISKKIPFVSTYDGFFVTSEELKRCPFSINTTTEIPRQELNSLGLSHATTHNLLLIGNPLAVGPMLNMPLLPPGKEKANFFEFAPNVDHTTRPATQTTTTQSVPIPWVQQPDQDDPDCIAISSACMLLVRLPQPDRQYTDPATRTIKQYLLDHDQHELNNNHEAFMYYRTDDPQDANSKKKATANWMKQTWGEDDTLREPCHICFRFEQSVENQLVHCKSPRCTRTYHQHCLQPTIAIRHRQPWICPIHAAAGHAPMPTMVFPSLGRFHPTMVRDEFDGITTQLADPATNASFVVSSRNQTSRTKYRKWLASMQSSEEMTGGIVDATSVLFWGVSCGSVRPFNEKIGNLFYQANDSHHALSHGDVRPALFHASIRSRMGLGLRARTDIAPNTFLVLDDPETSGVGTSMWSALLSSEFDPSCLAWIHFGVVAPLDSKINAQLALAQDFADDAFHAIVAENRKKMSDYVVLPLVLKTTRPIAAMEQLFFSNVIMGVSDSGPTREALVPYFMRPGMIQYNLDRDRHIVRRLHAVTNSSTASSSSAAAASSSSAAADLQPTTANSLHVLNLHQAIPRWSELFDEMGSAAAPLDVSDDRGPQKADALIDDMLSNM
jgi:hypothetical protein